MQVHLPWHHMLQPHLINSYHTFDASDNAVPNGTHSPASIFQPQWEEDEIVGLGMKACPGYILLDSLHAWCAGRGQFNGGSCHLVDYIQTRHFVKIYFIQW